MKSKKKYRYIIYFLFVFIFICKETSFSQWYSVENGSAGMVLEISFKDELTGWYISDQKYVYKTTNGGINWKCCDIYNYSIDSLDGLYPLLTSGDTIWVGANGGRILKSTNGGEYWTSIYLGSGARISGFCFIRQNLIYATNNNYLIKSTNGGLNWVTIYAFNISGYLDFINDSIGYYKEHRIIKKSTNYGYNWYNIYIDPDSMNMFFSYMKFIDESLGFLVKNSVRLYRTTDGGINWEYILPTDARDIIFENVNTGFMIGNAGRSRFYKTTNRGLIWDSLFTYNSINYNGKSREFRDLSIIGNTFYIAAIGGGGVLKSTNYGYNWIDLSPFFTQTFLFNSISFANSQTGFVGGSRMFLFKTTNSGNNWLIDSCSGIKPSNYINESRHIKEIQFVNENTGWILIDRDSGLYKTTNRGNNWIYKNLKMGRTKRMFFQNENVGFLLCDTNFPGYGSKGALYKTTNSGDEFKFICIINSMTTGIIFYDSLYGYITCCNILQGPNLYKTTDGGNNWQEIWVPFMIREMSLVDREVAYIATDFKGIFKTTNGGNTWDTSLYLNISCSSVFFVNRDTGFATNYYKNIYYTTNGGLNWTYNNLGTFYSALEKIYIIPRTNIGFTVGEYGKIYRTNNLGGIVGINSNIISIPDKYNLMQNYPNPFNSSTKIKYTIPKTAYIQIKIFDILGRKIDELIKTRQATGEYEINFSGNNLSSGVYFYSLFSDGVLIQTRKFVIIR